MSLLLRSSSLLTMPPTHRSTTHKRLTLSSYTKRSYTDVQHSNNDKKGKRHTIQNLTRIPIEDIRSEFVNILQDNKSLIDIQEINDLLERLYEINDYERILTIYNTIIKVKGVYMQPNAQTYEVVIKCFTARFEEIQGELEDIYLDPEKDLSDIARQKERILLEVKEETPVQIIETLKHMKLSGYTASKEAYIRMLRVIMENIKKNGVFYEIISREIIKDGYDVKELLKVEHKPQVFFNSALRMTMLILIIYILYKLFGAEMLDKLRMGR
eukprot:TRINITY_DN9736_c0_g1_i1.p1 TRINITY_DN9736_c0_g1~~TRINITY_DN9736_c0_g1_i1.p1  ORF type:complete len:270 (+),score=36.82 TRINITY_DN9736_c0_g1_i1:15-824(+)